MDELVRRLRQLELRITAGANEACGQAADRIEAQAAEIRSLRDQVDRWELNHESSCIVLQGLRDQIWEVQCICRTWDHPLATKILDLIESQ